MPYFMRISNVTECFALELCVHLVVLCTVYTSSYCSVYPCGCCIYSNFIDLSFFIYVAIFEFN